MAAIIGTYIFQGIWGFFTKPAVLRVLSVVVIVALCLLLARCFFNSYINDKTKLATHEQTVTTLQEANANLADVLAKEKESRKADERAQEYAQAQKDQLVKDVYEMQEKARREVAEIHEATRGKIAVVNNSPTPSDQKQEAVRNIYKQGKTAVATARINHLWDVYCTVSTEASRCSNTT